ncbi:MAG: DUF6261 family protein [Mediterranea sp.]|jgi:hypothetical protein|nr:DUF6261 family protein [Mediterranea sp.]
MSKNFIKAFAFYDLRLSEFFELADNLMTEVLPPDLAEDLEIGTPYSGAKQSYDKLVDIFLRNPAMRQTEKVVEVITKLRRKMTLLKRTLSEMLLDTAEGERLENARDIEYVARPYLKNTSHDRLVGVVAKAKEMADALRTTETLPKLTGIGLTEIVDDIATLAAEANNLLLARGEETAFKKALGTASKVRKTLEQGLKFLLYTAIPAYYVNATGDLAAKFERTILEINGVLDIYRHLTQGESRKSGSGGGEGGIPIDPSIPDTQPVNPPNGGTYIDPNA